MNEFDFEKCVDDPNPYFYIKRIDTGEIIGAIKVNGKWSRDRKRTSWLVRSEVHDEETEIVSGPFSSDHNVFWHATMWLRSLEDRYE